MIASVGVFTRPSETAPAKDERRRMVAARAAFMPTIQSASERERAACSSLASSSPGRSEANASLIAFAVIEDSHSRTTGFFAPAFSYVQAKISSPSRPASQALMTRSTSLRPSSFVITVICLRERSSRTTSRKSSGTIGRSAMRHFLYLASYSSGSASCTRWPTAHVTTWVSDSRYPSCFENWPGSARVRSRPTDGFSAMTSVLAMRRPTVAGRSTGTGAGGDRPRGLRERGADDRVGHPEAAARARRGRGEDGRHDAPAAVHHRAARVAAAHRPAQRGDRPPDRPTAVGVLRDHLPRPAQPPGPHVVRAVLREAEHGGRRAGPRA